MSDDKKKDAAPPPKDGAAAAAVPPKKANAAMGAILAGVVLLAVGAGVGVAGASLVAKWSTAADAKTEDPEAAAKAKEKEAAAAHGGGGHGLHGMQEVQLTEIKSNIKNQQGRRYVMVACSLYISDADALVLGFAGGGGHGGGKDAGGNVKRIMQQAIEEHLKTYDLEELTGNPYPALKKGFRDAVERAMHEVFPDVPEEHRFVERVVLTSLLVQ